MHLASKSLRSTGRVFIRLLQRTGKLADDNTAYGYKPTYCHLGRLRAFIDHEINFAKFANEIWGDSDREMEEVDELPENTQARGSGDPAPANDKGAKGLENRSSSHRMSSSSVHSLRQWLCEPCSKSFLLK
eukprot:5628410-Amphidinium_carterae.1